METKTEACPYRRAILWLAFLLQVICFSCLKPFSVFINPYILIFFPYIGPALIGEFLIYRILGKRDSHAANPQLVKDKFNLTLDELDIYIQKLINIRLMATVVAAISFGIGYFLDLPLYVVFATYLITTFGAMIYLRIKKKIKVPKRFFLIEGANSPVDEFSPSSSEPLVMSMEDRFFGGSSERYRDHLYGK